MPRRAMVSSFGVEAMVQYEVTTSINNLGCTSWQTTISKYRNTAILRAEATKLMSPSATCTNQWAWSVVGGSGTKSELIVRG